MKKILVFMIMFALAVIFTSNSVLAGGDQVIGAKSTGPSNQNGECPFTGLNF